jgi:hypothetical protein
MILNHSHGSLWDRGSADSYYQRPRDPHYYPEGTCIGDRCESLTADQVKAYLAGYEHNEKYGDKKSWD